MSELRLGDIIDDYCIKCRRLTNHAIVSLVDEKAAKVRCRTCYNDHDYRHEQAPPSKKDLKKAELFKEVLATMTPGTTPETGAVAESVPAEEVAATAEPVPVEAEPVPVLEAGVEEAPVAVEAPAAKRGRGRAKRA